MINTLIQILIVLAWIFGLMLAYITVGLGVLIVLSKIHLKKLWEQGAVPFIAFGFGICLWPLVLIIYLICLPIFVAKLLYMKATGLVVDDVSE